MEVIFDKDKILSHLNKVLTPEILQLPEEDMVKFLYENYSTHNHYKLTVDFFNTDFYKNSINKRGKRSLEEIRNDLYKINSKILESKTLDEETLTPLLYLLVDHLNGNYKFRYYVNIWRVDFERILSNLESTLDLCNQLNQYKDDPESGGIVVSDFNGRYLKSQVWNNVTMPTIWASIYIGLIEEGLYMIETLEELINKIHKFKSKNGVFPTVLDQNNPGRYIMTLYFAKAQIYLQQKGYKKAEECFELITQLYKGKGNHPKYVVRWPNGYNRITEAAIEVYKLNPTEENKNKAIDYYLSSTVIDDIEPTESTRERLLITYMLMTEILKIKVA